jgi:hypothetical protein
MFMSRHQTTGQNHHKGIKVAYKSFENVEKFKYVGTVVRNQNCIQEGVKSRSGSGNVCFNAAQNRLSSRLLSENVKIKINKPNCNCCFS